MVFAAVLVILQTVNAKPVRFQTSISRKQGRAPNADDYPARYCKLELGNLAAAEFSEVGPGRVWYLA